MNTPTLKTDRPILRRFTEGDLDAFYKIYSGKAVNTCLPWLLPCSKEAAKAFYEERSAAEYARPNGYRYAVYLKSAGIPIGYIGVSTGDSHDLRYGLREEFWYRGIAREAGSSVIAQAKQDGIPYITATHDVNNPRSGAVMWALGMHYQYSCEELWQPKTCLSSFGCTS